LIDGWQLWLNTISPTDIAYLHSMEAENSKVKVYSFPEQIIPSWQTYDPLITHKFLQFTHDDDTIYIRFDDDIIWVEDGAIEKIVSAKIDHPESFLIYPNIINSTICTSWHQEIGALSEESGVVKKEKTDDLSYAYLDEFNYSDSKLIDHIHNTFRKRYNDKTLSAYYLPSRFFDDYKHFSICSICWSGKDKLTCGRVEERQLSWELPIQLNRKVYFCGNALMVHYAYHTQRDYLEKSESDSESHLNFYRKINNINNK
jgi:hypothetical protein